MAIMVTLIKIITNAAGYNQTNYSKNKFIFLELTHSKIEIYLKSYVCVVLGDQMSIVSSARKGNLSTRSGATNKSSRRSVRFQLNYNLKSVLTDFENEKKQQSYKELVCNIRDAGLEIRVSCPLFFILEY